MESLPSLWERAHLVERRNMLMTMLDAVYVDTVESTRIVAIRLKAPLRPIFQLAATRAGCGVTLTPGPDKQQPEPGEQVFEAVFS